MVKEPLNERIDVVIADYVVDLGRRYAELHNANDGPRVHAEKMQDGLLRIRKRLGDAQLDRVSAMMADAFAITQEEGGDVSAHRGWIAVLLEEYYDQMYEYQLSKRTGPRLFTGNRHDVIDWAQQQQKSY